MLYEQLENRLLALRAQIAIKASLGTETSIIFRKISAAPSLQKCKQSNVVLISYILWPF